jgi:hypothetical protein
MPPSTTFGPKPYDVRLLTFSHRLFLTLAFNPETFVQKGAFCEGRYELRLSLWQAGRLLFWGERKLTLRAIPLANQTPPIYTPGLSLCPPPRLPHHAGPWNAGT